MQENDRTHDSHNENSAGRFAGIKRLCVRIFAPYQPRHENKTPYIPRHARKTPRGHILQIAVVLVPALLLPAAAYLSLDAPKTPPQTEQEQAAVVASPAPPPEKAASPDAVEAPAPLSADVPKPEKVRSARTNGTSKPLKITAESLTKEHLLIATTIMNANSRLPESEALAYAVYIMEASKMFTLDPALITGVLLAESRGHRNSISNKGAVGLMQVVWSLHGESLKKKFSTIRTMGDMLEARNNILAGSWILKGYMERNGHDIKKALTRYRGGHSASYISKILLWAVSAGMERSQI